MRLVADLWQILSFVTELFCGGQVRSIVHEKINSYISDAARCLGRLVKVGGVGQRGR